MVTCECHGREFKNQAGLAAHLRVRPMNIPQEDAPAETVSPSVAPLVEDLDPINLHLPSRTNLGAGGRSVKMLRYDPSNPAEPFFSRVEKKEQVPQYERMEDGRARVVGVDEIVWHEWQPNLEQAELSERQNNGRGVEWRKEAGWILPEEHPKTPFKPFCQYVDCWSQNIRFKTPHGDYCSEEQAKIVAADELGVRLEILRPDKRRKQLAEIAI